ncbi:ABC transporter ATP-binding protein [Candidatus Bathyarchaeota archaeon]|nr:MAG: ABC transporter ATP-binding protein [Candidatus Bathyarchaeota archaeon]
MLEINDLTVEVSGRIVLENVDLRIEKGETHILFGPNGSGKSSLIMTILGFPAYKVISGEIIFKGKNIIDLPINERVNLGISVAFQNPPAIRGVKLGDILNHWIKDESTIDSILERINFPREFLRRDINLGFSGGEMKKSEILQAIVQGGDLLLLDEPDSGVDVENLRLLGEFINEMLKGRAGLIITHQGHILRFIDADIAHVMLKGTIVCSGRPTRILSQIMSEGYGWCMKCPRRKRIRENMI